MGIKEDDLTLMSLAKLREMNDELDRISVEASGVLTHALMMREKEGQDKEVYNGMIQVRPGRLRLRLATNLRQGRVSSLLVGT